MGKLRILLLLLIVICITSCNINNGEYHIQTVEIPDNFTLEQKIELSAKVIPHSRQVKWFNDEFFGFIHFGPNTFTGREWGTGFENAAIFNPRNLDTDQWCRLMSEAGIKRAIVVAKHHEGFCLWQTRYTDFSVASSPWRDGQGDVIREMAASCQKYGLKMGIYLSPADLFQIESKDGLYNNGSQFTMREIPGVVNKRPFSDKRIFRFKLDDYNEYFMNQLFELLTEYGPVYEVWFDGANPKPGTSQVYNYDAWYSLIRELAPDAVIFGKGPDARWCGNEEGATRDYERNVIPIEKPPADFHWPDMMDDNIAGIDKITPYARFFHYYPAETNTSIRNGWFWRNDIEQQVKSADEIFDIYERSVGGNSVFLLNVPPDTLGRISNRDSAVLLEVGSRISDVYGKNLLSGGVTVSKNLLDSDNDTFWKAKGKNSEILIELDTLILLNRFMVQEAIALFGERVEEHHLEAWVNGHWEKIAEGATVGYKRILRFSPVKTSHLKLVITKSRLTPVISSLSAHYYEEPVRRVSVNQNQGGFIELEVEKMHQLNFQSNQNSNLNIYYTIDGTIPTEKSDQFTRPFILVNGGVILTRAIDGKRMGPVTEKRIGILKKRWEASDGNGLFSEAHKAIDGSTESCWASQTSDEWNTSLIIDMKQVNRISGFSYLPDKVNGFIEAFEVYISSNGKTWQKIHSGSFGNIRNDPSQRLVFFDKVYETRFFKLADLKPPHGENKISVSEIDIFPVVTNKKSSIR